MTAPADATDRTRPGGRADPAVEVAGDGPDAEVAEMLEAQARLRGLLAVDKSLVTRCSTTDVAEHLVEAAYATAGAGYARLELDQVDGSAPQVFERAAEPGRLASYRLHLEQRAPSGAAPGPRGRGGELGEFRATLDNGQQRLGRLQVLDRRRGGRFTELTEDLLTTLVATATLILDRASHHEQVERRAGWLAALRRVESLVLTSEDDELAVWSEIAESLQRLTSSDTVALRTPGEHDDTHILIAAGAGAQGMVGTSYPRAESLGWQSMQRGRGQVLASGAELPLGHHTLVDPQLTGPVMSVPLVGDSGPRGAVTLCRQSGQPLFIPGDLQLVEDFARQATVAPELAEARADRTRLEQTVAREAIARNLHDHVIQRLFAVGLSRQGVTGAEPAAMQRQLQQSVQDLDATIAQIRKTIASLRRSQ